MRTILTYIAVMLWGTVFLSNAVAENNSIRGPLPPKLQTASSDTNIQRTIGICQLIENPPIPTNTAFNTMSPTGSAWSYLRDVAKFSPEQVTDEMFVTAKASLLQVPAHGELKRIGEGDYRYIPVADYLGTDRATILVEMGGYKVKVIYHFKVGGEFGATEGYDSYEDRKNCPSGKIWNISTTNLNQ